MDRQTSSAFQPVEDWLRSLGLLHYAQDFYDNGYEDIETVKLIGINDLNAIGIKSEKDVQDLLSAVSRLKSNLYFELEADNSQIEKAKIKYDKLELKSKLKELLKKHHVQLIEPPYYNPDGSLGELYSLAIKYAEELNTAGIDDVLEALEQLRKRQLPVQSYDQINQVQSVANETLEKRRSMSSTNLDPAEYLNCEMSRPASRSLSFSNKYDPRVTKSTTDLTHGDARASLGKGGKKMERNKSIFGSMFRKKDNVKLPKSYDFQAGDVTLSQDQIVTLFARVKNKEISQEDALAAIKSGGLTKSNSFGSHSSDGSTTSETPLHTPPTSSTKLLTPKSSINRKDRLSRSVKRPSLTSAPTAHFYTDDLNASGNSSSNLASSGTNTSNASNRSHDSNSLQDFGSSPNSSASSPELEKSGIFASIRNSLRRKKSQEPGYTGPSTFTIAGDKTLISPPISPKTTEPPKSIGNNNTTKSTAVYSELNAQTLPTLITESPPKPVDIATGRVSDINSNVSTPKPTSMHVKRDLNKGKPLPPPRITRSSTKPVIPTPPTRGSAPIPQRSMSLESPTTPSSIDKIGLEMTKLIAGLDEDLEEINNQPETNEPVANKTSSQSAVAKKPMIPPRSMKRNLPSPVKPMSHNAFKNELEKSLKGVNSGQQGKGSLDLALKQKIQLKLQNECVNLHEEPYTSQDGSWNVPQALVQRYSKELEISLEDLLRVFEMIRADGRKEQNLSYISLDMKQFTKNNMSDTPLSKWLIDIGLPMFLKPLKQQDINTVGELSKLSVVKLQGLGRFKQEHIIEVLEKAKSSVLAL